MQDFTAGLLKIFRRLLSLSASCYKKTLPFDFSTECKNSFDKLKEKLTSAPVIQPPDWELPFEIMYDASNYAVGAVLGQRIGKSAHAIYYALRTLDNAQRNTLLQKRSYLQ